MPVSSLLKWESHPPAVFSPDTATLPLKTSDIIAQVGKRVWIQYSEFTHHLYGCNSEDKDDRFSLTLTSWQRRAGRRGGQTGVRERERWRAIKRWWQVQGQLVYSQSLSMIRCPRGVNVERVFVFLLWSGVCRPLHFILIITTQCSGKLVVFLHVILLRLQIQSYRSSKIWDIAVQDVLPRVQPTKKREEVPVSENSRYFVVRADRTQHTILKMVLFYIWSP